MKHTRHYPSLTSTARQVWWVCYGEAWPQGWRVEYAGFMRRAVGKCLHGERRILISLGDVKRHNIIEIMAHEFVHMRNPQLRHGREFTELVHRNLRKLWPDLLREAGQCAGVNNL